MTKILLPSLILFIVFSCNAPEVVKKENTLPNIIIIFTDDQGYHDVGCFGADDISTPNLDQMATEGVKLTHFYAAQAVCTASRAALLTGCYPNRIGMHQAFMPNNSKGIHPNEMTIAEMLKPKGYATAIFGKWHLGDHQKFLPNQHGFDEYFGIPYSNDMWPFHPQQGPIFDFGPLPLYEQNTIIDTLEDQTMLTTQITERSVAFIEKNKEQPFFLYIAHPQPHVPLFVSDKFKDKSGRGLYGDVIMEIDWSVGEVLKALKKNGLDDNTLVIFTSDNGPWLSYGEHSGSAYPLREGKGTAWEGGQREPCILRFPGRLPAGKTIPTPIMAIDVLPTLAALTQSPLPHHPIDGKNIWSILAGETTESPQEAYFFYYKINELHGVRYGKWKLYFPHTYRTMNGRSGGKGGFPADYEQIEMTEIELYDLENDERETKNVAAQNPEIVSQIKVLAEEMREKLGDSLTDKEGRENREVGKVK